VSTTSSVNGHWPRESANNAAFDSNLSKGKEDWPHPASESMRRTATTIRILHSGDHDCAILSSAQPKTRRGKSLLAHREPCR
jgi:hypothetical protein